MSASPSNPYQDPLGEKVDCNVTVSRDVNPLVLIIPSSCIGSPTSVGVQLETVYYSPATCTASGCRDSFSRRDTAVGRLGGSTTPPVVTPPPTTPPVVTPPPTTPPPTTPPVVVTPPRVARGVTIGIRQARGIYTFSGTVSPVEAGVQVTIARLDSVTKRVTGVASTRTDANGRYAIRSYLPVGFAGFYTLTDTRSDIPAGRSRLYGLVVPRR